MAKQVKAAVIEGPGKISIQHFPYPDLEKYEGAVLKVIQCGICGTDKHSYRGETRQNSGSDTEFNVAYPYIMGHEAVGILDAVSPGVVRKDFYGEEIHVGERITFLSGYRMRRMLLLSNSIVVSVVRRSITRVFR